MATKTTQARALVAITASGVNVKCGHVFEADAVWIKNLVKNGEADDDKEAIAAGLSEHADVVKLFAAESPAESEQSPVNDPDKLAETA